MLDFHLLFRHQQKWRTRRGDGDRGRTLEPLKGPGGGCKFPSFEVAKGVGPSLVVIPCLLTPYLDVYRQISMRARRSEPDSLPNLLGAKTSSCPDGPPHRGRQIVLLRHVRVQQGSRWKGAQPW